MRPRLRVPLGSGRHLGVGPTSALRDAVRAAEPGSALIAIALHGATRRPIVLTVEDRSGTVLGALALERQGPTQWDALPLVVDRACAPVLARLVHLSPASVVLGVGPHVMPLVGRLPRVRSVGRSPFFGAPADGTMAPTDLDPRSRAATLADLDALADLFASSYPLGRPPDRASWRRQLRRTLADGFAVVAEADGQVVAGALCPAVSPTRIYVGDGVVRADHRGQGLSWAMVDRVTAILVATGVDSCGAMVEGNPMDPETHYADHGTLDDELWGVALDAHLAWPSVRWRRRQVRRARRWAGRGLDAARQRSGRARGRRSG